MNSSPERHHRIHERGQQKLKFVLRKFLKDIRQGRHVDAYVVLLVCALFALASIFGDFIPINARWAVLFSGVGLLVYRTITPTRQRFFIDDLAADRTAFDALPVRMRLSNAREVWLFAPSGINILSPDNCALLQTHVLKRAGAIVRIIVLDPNCEDGIRIASRQLDDNREFSTQQLAPSLASTISRLRAMRAREGAGAFEFKLFSFNPGFSIFAINPNDADGRVIVEFHGYRNDSDISRMHLEIGRMDGSRWYPYWVDQFESIWRNSRPDKLQS